MYMPILATKLYIPPPRPKAVLRPRLIERLNDGLYHNRKLTLIAAPAGFGKTTLLSAWVAACGRPVAWLSLDKADSDPVRFLTYVVMALQKIAANIGAGLPGLLQSPQPPPVESVLTALLNEITTVPDNFVLILDDYHMIDAKPVDEALTFLLEHLPPQMHLVIATREDPQLPLARLRVRDQLTELRVTELRFSPTEAAGFLKQVMGLDLSPEDVTALEAHTEGWIAGLQLAAISLQGRQDVPGFIRAFAGDNRYIVDYLVEEVLQRQPEPVRHFLLQTAILDRLNGPLCDAVTGQQEGNARLEALERGNFFVVPLDDKRHWYRYHHLFAEVLYAHLMAEQPDQVSNLHRRASEWYEHNGLAAEAIRHALAARNFERAADLAEKAVAAMRRSRQEAMLLIWLKALPDELVRRRPVLSVHYAGALLSSGELEGVEARLRDAERWLDQTAEMSARPDTSPAGMVVVDEEEFRRLPGSIAIYRAGSALAQGDVPGTVKYARLALDLVPEEYHLGRGAAAGLLGLAYWTRGDLEEAYRSYADCMARLQRAGHIFDAIGSSIALADIRIAQGRLHEAMTIYERSLQLAQSATEPVTEQGQGAPVLRGTADMYVGMGVLYREYNDLNAATEHLLRSQALGELAGLPQNPYRWCVAMAHLREAQGDPEGALELLNEAERLYVSDFFPNVRPIAELKTRVWVAQGRMSDALGWVREKGLSVEDELSYLREFQHITLARVLLARSRYKNDHEAADRSILEVMGLLERLLKAAQAGERTGSVIEILVLHSLAHHVQGDIPAALLPLQQALTLAEPEGYVRMFVDEGLPMAQLLRAAAARGIMPDYTGKLLAAFEAEQPTGAVEPLPSIIPTSTSPASQPLIEPLSQRELAVLRLFNTELSGPEIAQELVIALSTLRTHTKSIYSKLNVSNRRAAVKRAEELNLI
jgi:LuxR family maltose regulon positive regulatory protein